MVFPINTDEDVQFFFSPVSGYKTVEVFVEAEKVYQNIVADDSLCWSIYIPPQDDGYSEPEADSFLNHDPVDSEPEEFENNQDGQNDNNPEEDDDDDGDDVSIAVMLEVLGNNVQHIQKSLLTRTISLLVVGVIFTTQTPESLDMKWFSRVKPLESECQDFSVRFARREFRVVESKPKLWKVVCKYDEATGCNWMLRAGFKAKMELFKITKYVGPHMCLMNEISIDHHNLGKSMIATHLLGMVRQDPAYDIKYVQQNVKDRFGFDISYHKAWHALKAAREEVYGTWESSVLPLAFALVDEESLESWRWFMDMLAKHLMLGDDDRICLISDRHSGIISAINFVPAFQFPRGVHHFCLRHICSNFNKKFNNIQLKDLCWRAGAEQNVRKFDRILEEIRGLNEEAFNWLQRIDKAQWTLSHDGGCEQGEAVHHIVQKFDYNQQSASVLTIGLTVKVHALTWLN
ncbi:UNVERIFIED_CONTAM: hypothetical protein Sangu_3112500 [Sesamum angustifolium]|uniref:MULE transposase domain-containing protein n=1 Tax=Sesamum angustifolium TaxID=2727405 RepID=A0AAW2K812_9LAMI